MAVAPGCLHRGEASVSGRAAGRFETNRALAYFPCPLLMAARGGGGDEEAIVCPAQSAPTCLEISQSSALSGTFGPIKEVIEETKAASRSPQPARYADSQAEPFNSSTACRATCQPLPLNETRPEAADGSCILDLSSCLATNWSLEKKYAHFKALDNVQVILRYANDLSERFLNHEFVDLKDVCSCYLLLTAQGWCEQADKASDSMLSIMVQLSMIPQTNDRNATASSDREDLEIITWGEGHRKLLTINFDRVMRIRRKLLVGLLEQLARSSCYLPCLIPLTCSITRQDGTLPRSCALLNLDSQIVHFCEILIREATTFGVSKSTLDESTRILQVLFDKQLVQLQPNQDQGFPHEMSRILRLVERMCKVCCSNVVCTNVDSRAVLEGDVLLEAVGRYFGKLGELNSKTCRMFLRACRLRGIRPLKFLDAIAYGEFPKFEILCPKDYIICLESCSRALQRLSVTLKCLSRQNTFINATDSGLAQVKQECESCWKEALTIWKEMIPLNESDNVKGVKSLCRFLQQERVITMLQERKSIFKLAFDSLINLVHVHVIRAGLGLPSTPRKQSEAQRLLGLKTGEVLHKEESLRTSNETFVIGMQFVEKILYSLFGCEHTVAGLSLCNQTNVLCANLEANASTLNGLLDKLQEESSQDSLQSVNELRKKAAKLKIDINFIESCLQFASKFDNLNEEMVYRASSWVIRTMMVLGMRQSLKVMEYCLLLLQWNRKGTTRPSPDWREILSGRALDSVLEVDDEVFNRVITLYIDICRPELEDLRLVVNFIRDFKILLDIPALEILVNRLSEISSSPSSSNGIEQQVARLVMETTFATNLKWSLESEGEMEDDGRRHLDENSSPSQGSLRSSVASLMLKLIRRGSIDRRTYWKCAEIVFNHVPRPLRSSGLFGETILAVSKSRMFQQEAMEEKIWDMLEQARALRAADENVYHAMFLSLNSSDTARQKLLPLLLQDRVPMKALESRRDKRASQSGLLDINNLMRPIDKKREDEEKLDTSSHASSKKVIMPELAQPAPRNARGLRQQGLQGSRSARKKRSKNRDTRGKRHHRGMVAPEKSRATPSEAAEPQLWQESYGRGDQAADFTAPSFDQASLTHAQSPHQQQHWTPGSDGQAEAFSSLAREDRVASPRSPFKSMRMAEQPSPRMRTMVQEYSQEMRGMRAFPAPHLEQSLPAYPPVGLMYSPVPRQEWIPESLRVDGRRLPVFPPEDRRFASSPREQRQVLYSQDGMTRTMPPSPWYDDTRWSTSEQVRADRRYSPHNPRYDTRTRRTPPSPRYEEMVVYPEPPLAERRMYPRSPQLERIERIPPGLEGERRGGFQDRAREVRRTPTSPRVLFPLPRRNGRQQSGL
eukprot:767099-Hanusia_phi.AAC.2